MKRADNVCNIVSVSERYNAVCFKHERRCKAQIEFSDDVRLVLNFTDHAFYSHNFARLLSSVLFHFNLFKPNFNFLIFSISLKLMSYGNRASFFCQSEIKHLNEPQNRWRSKLKAKEPEIKNYYFYVSQSICSPLKQLLLTWKVEEPINIKKKKKN